MSKFNYHDLFHYRTDLLCQIYVTQRNLVSFSLQSLLVLWPFDKDSYHTMFLKSKNTVSISFIWLRYGISLLRRLNHSFDVKYIITYFKVSSNSVALLSSFRNAWATFTQRSEFNKFLISFADPSFMTETSEKGAWHKRLLYRYQQQPQ